MSELAHSENYNTSLKENQKHLELSLIERNKEIKHLNEQIELQKKQNNLHQDQQHQELQVQIKNLKILVKDSNTEVETLRGYTFFLIQYIGHIN